MNPSEASNPSDCSDLQKQGLNKLNVTHKRVSCKEYSNEILTIRINTSLYTTSDYVIMNFWDKRQQCIKI